MGFSEMLLSEEFPRKDSLNADGASVGNGLGTAGVNGGKAASKIKVQSYGDCESAWFKSGREKFT